MVSRFIEKLFAVVSDSNISNIQWLEDDKFIIHKPQNLQRDIRHFFKSQKVKSFVRQLHFYGFKKVGGTRYEEWIYFNKHFTKIGNELEDIKRNSPHNFDDLAARIEKLEAKPDLLARIEALEQNNALLQRIESLEKQNKELKEKIEKMESPANFLVPITEVKHEFELNPDLLISTTDNDMVKCEFEPNPNIFV